MSELINASTLNTYSIDNPYEEVSMDRDEFYAEQIEGAKKGGIPTIIYFFKF
ncbi:hypothetical protein MK079_05020 [Candidatus Gracilibacteria bacterium]|nr:hypothetical protein [Candidatus Gracilibacteria bacterium]